MLTRSAIYEAFAIRHGIQVDTIVKITKGSDAYFFSFRPMPRGLATAPIYPVLYSCGAINESIDIYSKQLQHGDLTIVLRDLPFYPDVGSTPQSASSLLTAINGSTVDIYFMAGDAITDIDDCLHVFSGYVLTAPTLRNALFTFSVENKIKITDVLIPPRLIQDELGYAPVEFRRLPIPLVYGIFHLGEQKDWFSEYVLDYPGTGLVKGYPTSNARHAYYIIADHDIYIQDAFFTLDGPTVVFIEYPRFAYTGANSRLLVGPEALELICSLIFPVESDLPGIYDDESYQAENPEDAQTFDGQYATMKDNQFDNTSTISGLGLWAFKHPELFAKHFTSAHLIKAYYTNLIAKSGVTITHINADLYYGREDGSDDKIRIGQLSGGISYSGVYEIDNTGVNADDLVSNLLEEYLFALEVKSSALGQGDGILDNQEMLDVDRLHVSLCWTLEDRPNEIWTTCKGEYFGSWISAIGRSNPGGFTTTRHIEHIIYIIESLYRIYLELGDDDIDTESFDNAYEEVLEGRINILTQRSLSEYVRQLCEQSTFAICHSSAGQVRAVKLNDATPTIQATIERSHLIDDSMSVEKISRLVNRLKVNSNWHAEYNKFFDLDVYEDTTSQTEYRTREAEYTWENITGAAVDYVANHYVNDIDGLWSNEHIQGSFKTIGQLHSHLEIGDWIRLSVDLDDLRTPFGGTWYGKDLLITDIAKSDSWTEIIAVEIIAFEAATSPSPSAEPSPSPVEDGLWLLDDDTDPANSTLVTGYSALLDGIYNVLACKPFTEGPSVGIDMGEIVTLESLRLYDTGIFGAGLKTGAQLKLYISNNNATWSYIETYTSMSRIATGGTYDPYYIDCVFTSNQTARYFKLYSPGEPLKVPAGYSLILSEIEATLAVSPSPSP